MNKQETAAILMQLSGDWDVMSGNENQRMIKLNQWHKALKNYPYKVVEKAVEEYYQTRSYTPHPKDLIDIIISHDVKNDFPTVDEAIAQISKAVSNSNYHAEEELEKLHPLVRATVGSAAQLRAWAMMETTTFQSVVVSNLKNMYQAKLDRVNNERFLQEEDRTYTNEIMSRSYDAPAIEDKTVDDIEFAKTTKDPHMLIEALRRKTSPVGG